MGSSFVDFVPVVAVVVMLAGCKDETKASAPPQKSAPAKTTDTSEVAPKSSASSHEENAFAGATITLGGKPIAMKNAFVKSLPDGGFQTYVSTSGGSCRELLTNLFDSCNDGCSYLLLTIAGRLAPDGKTSFVITDVSSHGPGDPDPGSKVVVDGDASKEGKTKLGIDVDSKEKNASMHGTFVAIGCGPEDISGGPGVPKSPHPSSATMTIAGKKFPVRGAIREGADVTFLDFPKDCGPATWFMGARIERTNGAWTLDGSWFASEQTASSAPAFSMKEGAKGKSDDGDTISLTLSGTGKIGDFDVTLDGTVEALDCPK